MRDALNEEGSYCIHRGDEVADTTRQLARPIYQSQRRAASLFRTTTWTTTIGADADADVGAVRWHPGSISEVEDRR